MQDLNRVKDHLIGQDIDGTMSGISGGERRRVSVGISLVTDAQAIFLDEPTTGLDSESAETLMQLLARLAQNRGKTVSAPLSVQRTSSPSKSSILSLPMAGACSQHMHACARNASCEKQTCARIASFHGCSCSPVRLNVLVRGAVAHPLTGMLHMQVVCTIHQPSTDICSLFDDAMLLSGEDFVQKGLCALRVLTCGLVSPYMQSSGALRCRLV